MVAPGDTPAIPTCIQTMHKVVGLVLGETGEQGKANLFIVGHVMFNRHTIHNGFQEKKALLLVFS